MFRAHACCCVCVAGALAACVPTLPLLPAAAPRCLSDPPDTSDAGDGPLLPTTPGSSWTHDWALPNLAPLTKTTTVVDADVEIPETPGTCPKAGRRGVELDRTQSDGERETRFMSVDDAGAVWWERDEREDGSVQIYCPRKLRVPSDDMLRCGRIALEYDSIEIDPDGVKSIEHKLDAWELVDGRDPTTVPAGAFDAVRLHRAITAAEEPSKIKLSDFWFARGVGKVREDTELVEVEELASFSVVDEP